MTTEAFGAVGTTVNPAMCLDQTMRMRNFLDGEALIT